MKEYKARVVKVNEEGVAYLKELLQTQSMRLVDKFVKHIEKQVNGIVRTGKSVASFHQLDRSYKMMIFGESGRQKFNRLVPDVFVPYESSPGKASWSQKHKLSLRYRINTSFIDKYMQSESVTKELTRKIETEIQYEQSPYIRRNLTLLRFTANSSDKREEVMEISEDLVSDDIDFTGKKGFILREGGTENRYQQLQENETDCFLDICYELKALYVVNAMLKWNNNVVSRKEYEERAYHKLALLNKKIYPHISFKGESIGEIDISNCVPMLLINAMTGIHNPFGLFQGNKHASKFRILANTRTKYIHLVRAARDGSFYQFVARTVYKLKLTDVKELEKKTKLVKRRIAQVLYGKPKSGGWLGKQMVNHFPDFILALDLEKKRIKRYIANNPDSDMSKKLTKNGAKTPFKAGSDAISVIGMIMESNIILDNVIPAMKEAGLNVIPKHDAILFPDSQKRKVATVLLSVFDKIFGKNKYDLKYNVYELRKDMKKNVA